MAFLHGVETVNIDKNGRPVKSAKSSVIVIVGTAPQGPVNDLKMIVSDADAAQFGKMIPGFDIPYALDTIRQYGYGTIIVANVFDPETMVTAVTNETHTVTDFKFKLTYTLVDGMVLKNNAGDTTFVKDTDYKVDEWGNVTILKPSVIAEGSTVKASYNKPNAAAVDADVIIGEVDEDTNARTGLQLLDLVYSQFGVTPKIILCPDWNIDTEVAAEIEAKANYWRAVFPLDAEEDVIPSAVIESRSPAGTDNISTTSSRAIICYPKVKISDPDPSAESDAYVLRPMSETVVGIIALTDETEGYWVSPSNQKILGILGLERPLTWILNKSDTEVNQLNSYGVMTIVKDYDYLTWGNRNALYPREEGIKTFISMQRLEDIIQETIEFYSRPFVGKPINGALIDAIITPVNAFFRLLQGRGAVIDGICSFNPDNNPAEDLANGNIKFDYEFVGPPPAERITFRSYTNVSLLKTIA